MGQIYLMILTLWLVQGVTYVRHMHGGPCQGVQEPPALTPLVSFGFQCFYTVYAGSSADKLQVLDGVEVIQVDNAQTR